MSSDAERLLKLFTDLSGSDRASLLAFAEFLRARSGNGVPLSTPSPAPEQPVAQPLPRPGQETVVAALKRLSISYPMLDKSKLLHETSGLVTQNIMQGRDAGEVIDEMEAIFVRHYRRWRGEEE